MANLVVIPAHAGIQCFTGLLDARIRGHDNVRLPPVILSQVLLSWCGAAASTRSGGSGMKAVAMMTVFLIIFSSAVLARHRSDHPLSTEDWEVVMQRVVLLERTGLMPTLLPVIMRNRDALQLSDEQVNAFREWRKNNYTNMVNIMNKIIEKMMQFRVDALSPDIPDARLLASQSEIHDLQRQLLEIKLSCRDLVMTTFTDDQWENFAFVVADNPRLASLMLQVNK
jgi:hypothetical protein